MIVEQLASDPGVGNIVVWTIVIGALGTGLLWALTTVLLQTRADDTDGQSHDASSWTR
jgi:hypothetical protein